MVRDCGCCHGLIHRRGAGYHEAIGTNDNNALPAHALAPKALRAIEGPKLVARL